VNKSDPFGLDPSAYQWALGAGPIEIQRTGNWGDKNSKDYYKGGLTADGKSAEGVTQAAITTLKPQDNGGVKATIFVDTHVRPEHKGDLVDDREQEHPDGFKELTNNKLSDRVLGAMAKDSKSYNSLKEFAEGRASHVQKLFDAEKDRQNVWHMPGQRHDYNNPVFDKNPHP
jgi:hypothetical protein